MNKDPVPLKIIVKKVLVDLYCRGAMPKEVTQKLCNLLRLKDL